MIFSLSLENSNIRIARSQGKIEGRPTGVGQVLAHIDGSSPAAGTAAYYGKDHIGSTRTLYSAAKAELATVEFTPYGTVLTSSGTLPSRLFTGQYWDDDAGLYYYPFRYLMPGTQHWISPEPFGIDGPNVYHYGFGTPVMGWDSYGLFCHVIGGAIGGAVSGGINGFIGRGTWRGALSGALRGAVIGGVGAACGPFASACAALTAGGMELLGGGSGWDALGAAGGAAVAGALGFGMSFRPNTPSELQGLVGFAFGVALDSWSQAASHWDSGYPNGYCGI